MVIRCQLQGEDKMNRISKDEYYLNIALAVSKRSTCLKRHYGCVIVKDDRIVSTGYNGAPRGDVNCCDLGKCKRPDAERYSDYTSCEAVHAEQNAIISASAEELKGATLYLACEGFERVESISKTYINIVNEDKNPVPCPLCMRMIKNAGISKVVNRKGVVYQYGQRVFH